MKLAGNDELEPSVAKQGSKKIKIKTIVACSYLRDVFTKHGVNLVSSRRMSTHDFFLY